ncbi:MAG: glycosyltransferase, partial [Singulisphaera sp.]
MGVPCDVLPCRSAWPVGDAGASGIGRRLALAGRGLGAASSLVGYARRLAVGSPTRPPDLVQTNGMKMHGLAAWATPRGVPVVWHLHDYLGSRAAMAGLLRLAALRRGIEGVAVSESVAADATAALRGRVPVRAIHNAVDLDRFHPGPGDGPSLDRASGLPEAPEGTVRVGLVATFADWKG